MPKFSANLSFLFNELPMMQRFGAARAHGFRGVEYLFPYDYDVAALAEELRLNDLEQVLFNLPAGDFAAGERGFAVDPKRREEFRDWVEYAARIAPILGCTRINCLVGKAVDGVSDATMWSTLVDNLRHAAARFEPIGVTLLIEPLNGFETPGYFIDTPSRALRLIDELGVPNARLQYDCYHAQRVEGNIIQTIRRHAHHIGHIQIADSPGRNEPGTGELAYDRILREIDASGYTGWVGLEYTPSMRTSESFAWIERYGMLAAAV
jgi:hydroxypyruvate isomerase